jgi:PIN domain nuclease of toxin-antitoxin system
LKLLLDTQAFLWWMTAAPALSRPARAAIAAPDHEVHFSIASAWEIAIKRSLGKLRLEGDVGAALESEDFVLLPIALSHVEELQKLPSLHHDPFDRMLIAQARSEGMQLVTSDSQIARYEVERLW